MEHIESTGGIIDRLLGCYTLILDEVDQLLETGLYDTFDELTHKMRLLIFNF